jgi:hypothetical protein
LYFIAFDESNEGLVEGKINIWDGREARWVAGAKKRRRKDIPRVQLRQLHKRVRRLLMPALRELQPREFEDELETHNKPILSQVTSKVTTCGWGYRYNDTGGRGK